MNARTIGLIFRKELLDVVRDRRAMLLMLALPIVLYPLLIIGFHYASLIQLQVLEKKTAKVWVSELESLPGPLRAELEKPERHLELESEPAGADERAALAEGTVRACLHPPHGLGAEVARVTTTALIQVIYNGGLDPSLDTRRKISDAIRDWRDELVHARLREHGLDRAILEPVAAASVDLAPPGAILGRLLATVLVLTSLMGAFYPAIDLGAGEKERGTLETLLLSPVHRVEIATGKFLAVATVGLASALLNLASLGLTFSHFMSLASGGELLDKLGSVSVTLQVVLPMATAILPLVALFSALALGIATLATSYKEATSYIQPLAFVASFLSMASALPGIELTPWVSLVPVAGVSLLFRELLGGTARPVHVALVVGSSFVYAALALRWVAHLYEQEEVLARPAAALGLGLLARRRADEPGPRVPTQAQGVAAGVLVLLLLWFAGYSVKAGFVVRVALPLVMLVAAPPLLSALWLRLDYRETFQLRPPPRSALVAAVLVALGSPIVGRDIAWLQGRVTGDPLPQIEEASKHLLVELQGLGPVVALFVIAFLPAVCEELLFRGFVLRGLGTRRGPLAATLGTAVLFGLAHLDPAGLGARTALGFVLGLLVVRSGSLVPAVLCHFCHNGLVLALAFHEQELEGGGLIDHGHPSLLLRIGAIAAVGAGLGVLRGTRPLAS